MLSDNRGWRYINFKNRTYVPETNSVLSSCLFHSSILFITSWKHHPSHGPITSNMVWILNWLCVQLGSIQGQICVTVHDMQEIIHKYSSLLHVLSQVLTHFSSHTYRNKKLILLAMEGYPLINFPKENCLP